MIEENALEMVEGVNDLVEVGRLDAVEAVEVGMGIEVGIEVGGSANLGEGCELRGNPDSDDSCELSGSPDLDDSCDIRGNPDLDVSCDIRENPDSDESRDFSEPRSLGEIRELSESPNDDKSRDLSFPESRPTQLDFREQYNLYYARLYSKCFSIVKDRHLAEDLVHDTFIKALKALETGAAIKDERKMGAWLTVIATRVALDYLRSEGRKKGILMEGEFLDSVSVGFQPGTRSNSPGSWAGSRGWGSSPDSTVDVASRIYSSSGVVVRQTALVEKEVEYAWLREEIQSAIGSLKPRYREVMRLKINEDLKESEIAEELHLKPSTVKIRLYRGKQKLKAMLTDL
ncbi:MULTISPECIES: RNA polymerase sigma factor [Bacillaceae]|uniref:RNA polymerase sigma factor n=1 Tax=Evansella alkalicola TaxID=745819 RepID=A0ABS6JVZ9_9BACI|nr:MULTISPECIES: RNA polymerase sigma factor [Bacillaceae]MBU9722762.1 RNA polymerase sigma factor [Bacillus alkalicola]